MRYTRLKIDEVFLQPLSDGSAIFANVARHLYDEVWALINVKRNEIPYRDEIAYKVSAQKQQ